MTGIKRTPADAAFSDCVRKRANWSCERCGTSYGGPSQALHCSHYIGRGNHSTRHDPRAAFSLCYGCHRYLGSHPHLHEAFAREKLGHYNFEALKERANDIRVGRQIKRELKDVAKHYREQFAAMEPGGQFEGYL